MCRWETGRSKQNRASTPVCYILSEETPWTKHRAYPKDAVAPPKMSSVLPGTAPKRLAGNFNKSRSLRRLVILDQVCKSQRLGRAETWNQVTRLFGRLRRIIGN